MIRKFHRVAEALADTDADLVAEDCADVDFVHAICVAKARKNKAALSQPWSASASAFYRSTERVMSIR